MERIESCGTTLIRYPDECTYVCSCGHVSPQGGSYCMWAVKCGDWITGGTGRIKEPSRHQRVKVDGKLVACAKLLERVWKRHVIVPKKVRGRTVKRTCRGTPEQIAQALGLELGPKLKRSKSR